MGGKLMTNPFDFSGKVAVIVGGGGDIGGAIAKGFAEHNAKVVIVGRSAERLERRAAKIKESCGIDILCYPADAGDEESVRALYERVIDDLERVDILVNSQAVNMKFPAMEHPMDKWDEMFTANVRSIMLTCKYFGRYMTRNGSGRIINISSIGAVRTRPTDISVCYGSTKGAVNSLSLTLAAGWAQYGVTVNCVGPIMTETEMMKSIFEEHPEIRTESAARVPMKRMALPEDCVGPTLFFASDAAAFITGQILYADGGCMTLQ